MDQDKTVKRISMFQQNLLHIRVVNFNASIFNFISKNEKD